MKNSSNRQGTHYIKRNKTPGMDPTIALGVVAFLVGLWYFLRQSWRNLPPGPRGLPIVGYIPFMGKCKLVNADFI